MKFSNDQSGVSLVIISAVVAAAAVVTVSVLPGQKAGDSNLKAKTTVEKLSKNRTGIQGFADALKISAAWEAPAYKA